MSSLLHSMKKALVKGDARPDSQFVDARARFEQYAEVCVRLRGNIHAYLHSLTSLLTTAASISTDLTSLIDDPDSLRSTGPGGPSSSERNEYSTLVGSLRQEHLTLVNDVSPQLSQTINTQLISELEGEITSNQEIQKRINRRMELFSEVGYYQGKLNELRKERDARASKGKVESAADTEKWNRNVKKLEEIELSFKQFDATLMQDMQRKYEKHRIAFFGPFARTFAKEEKRFVNSYSERLQHIPEGQ